MILKYTMIHHHEYRQSISKKLSIKFYQNKRFIFYEKFLIRDVKCIY